MKPTNAVVGATMALCLVLLIGAGAKAAIITTTYTGAVSYQYDPEGLFAPVGVSLVGEEYQLTYTTDDSAPGTIYYNIHDKSNIVTASYVMGPDLTSALLTVGQYSMSINGDDSGDQGEHNIASGFSDIATQSCQFDNGIRYCLGSEIYSLIDNFVPNGDYYGPITHLLQPNDQSNSGFSSDTNGNGGSTYFEYFFTTNSVTVSYVGAPTFSGPGFAVPEPSVWAMMLVGFGGLGLMMRSRRKQLTPV